MRVVPSKNVLNFDWPALVVGTVVIAVIAVGSYFIVTSITDAAAWEKRCYAAGGLIVETHEEGNACIDRDRRIIEP